MFANPDLTTGKDLHQPSIFNGTLKAYQLKVNILKVINPGVVPLMKITSKLCITYDEFWKKTH